MRGRWRTSSEYRTPHPRCVICKCWNSRPRVSRFRRITEWWRCDHLWCVPVLSPISSLGWNATDVYRCRPPLMSAAHTSPTLSLTLQWGDWSNGIQDSPVYLFFYLGVKTGKLEKKVKSPLPKFRTTYSYNIFLILSHSHSRVVHLWVLPNAMVSPTPPPNGQKNSLMHRFGAGPRCPGWSP